MSTKRYVRYASFCMYIMGVCFIAHSVIGLVLGPAKLGHWDVVGLLAFYVSFLVLWLWTSMRVARAKSIGLAIGLSALSIAGILQATGFIFSSEQAYPWFVYLVEGVYFVLLIVTLGLLFMLIDNGAGLEQEKERTRERSKRVRMDLGEERVSG